jgi:hypothetical protein
MEIRPLEVHDRAALEALLVRAGLPLAGVGALRHGVIGREAGRVIAAAAIEIHAAAGVLRSVVVSRSTTVADEVPRSSVQRRRSPVPAASGSCSC